MTKRLVCFFVFCLAVHLCQASLCLMVSKSGEDKVFLLKTGAVVKFQFNGYQGQTQVVKGRIVSLDSQFVEVEDLALFKKTRFRIAVADLTGFRPYSTLRQLGKSGVELGLVAGNIAFYSAVVAPAAIAPAAVGGISIGIALISYGVVKMLFPDSIKYKSDKGWVFKVIEVPEKPALKNPLPLQPAGF